MAAVVVVSHSCLSIVQGGYRRITAVQQSDCESACLRPPATQVTHHVKWHVMLVSTAALELELEPIDAMINTLVVTVTHFTGFSHSHHASRFLSLVGTYRISDAPERRIPHGA